MSGDEVPEFDDFEYADEEDDDEALWAGFELPAEAMTSVPPPAGFEEDVGDYAAEDIPKPTKEEQPPSAAQSSGLGRTRVPPYAMHPSGGNGHQHHQDLAQSMGTRRGQMQLSAVEDALHMPDETSVNEDDISVNHFSSQFQLMEMLAAAAVKSKKTSTAGQLAGAMVPLAFISVSRYQRELQPVIPVLIRGVASVAELMCAENAQKLIRLLPTILDRTAMHLARLAVQGQRVDRRLASDILADVASVMIEQGSVNPYGSQDSGEPRWEEEDDDYDDH